MGKLFSTSAVALLLATSAASASTLSLVGGDSGNPVPTNFGPLRDVNGAVATPSDLTAPVTIFDYDDNAVPLTEGLFVSGDSSVQITLTYLGFEAGNTNFGSSVLAGGSLFSNETSVSGDSITFTQSAGSGTLVDVFFSTLGEFTQPCSITNGLTFGSTCQLAFTNIFNDGTSTYALFGDGFGDSDLDDLVFRIDVTAVPLPAAGFLLVAGLGGLAATRRKKAKS